MRTTASSSHTRLGFGMRAPGIARLACTAHRHAFEVGATQHPHLRIPLKTWQSAEGKLLLSTLPWHPRIH